MAHESFEDDDTAAYMNDHFVNIKVDREERPDIDRIYMDALQAMTGHGGWPMTVFLTPDGGPFFGGTYYPKEPRGHMPSFRQVLASVSAAWTDKRNEIDSQAQRLADAVREGIPAGDAPPVDAAIETFLAHMVTTFDSEWGGFGGAPKFPQAPLLGLMLKTAVHRPATRPTIEPMLRRTLDAMRAGGIYDQIGGGFARYSVDEQWLIPHFEKMLYDNAVLARIYLHAGTVFDAPRYTATARGILDYLAKGMRDDAGGIHAAEDADSEGEEGKFYVWSYEEFREVAGGDADIACHLYGVTPSGNFEGNNNLYLPSLPESAAEALGIPVDDLIAVKLRVDAALLEARRNRVRPGKDDKVIAAWNGLALRAFAEAAAVLEEPGYLEVATGIARFVTTEMINEEGRLMRSWRRGRTSGPGFADDYAGMAVGLFTLYQASGDARWFHAGERLTLALDDLFGGPDGLHSTGSDHDDLISRPRDFMDNPLPSANSLAAEAFTFLEAYTGQEPPWIDSVKRGAARLLERAPHAVPHLLGVLLTRQVGVKEVAIVGDPQDRRPLERELWARWRPDCVMAMATEGDEHMPLLKGRTTIDGAAAAYVCQNFICELPVTSPESLAGVLSDKSLRNSPRSRHGT